MLPNCAIKCTVIVKRLNHDVGYGLEISVNFKFLGPAKAIHGQKRLRKKLIKL